MYVRSPFSPLEETTARPIFLVRVPEMKPRTLCACQLVASTIAFSVTPPWRFISSTTVAVLLPSRVVLAFGSPVCAFFERVAFLPGVSSMGATSGAGSSTVASGSTVRASG